MLKLKHKTPHWDGGLKNDYSFFSPPSQLTNYPPNMEERSRVLKTQYWRKPSRDLKDYNGDSAIKDLKHSLLNKFNSEYCK